VVLIATTIMRFTVGARSPLWLDETWTGMIASQPTLADFARQCYLDVNGPLYYLIAWPWAHLSGLSNAALRFPAFLFGAATPLVALLPVRIMDRQVRFVWSAFLACWIPGLAFSQEARCYSLVLFLGAANAVAYAALLRGPSARRAWTWTAVSSLLILSHYYGLVLVGIQGVAYLAIHRARALRTWPAAFAFAPAAASLTMHAMLLLKFASADRGWIPLLTVHDLFAQVVFVFGPAFLIAAMCLVLLLALVWRLRSKDRPAGAAFPVMLGVVVACSIAAAIVAVSVGFVRPAYVNRYLTAFVPGVFLGVALLADRLSRHLRLAPQMLAALPFSVTILWAALTGEDGSPFNFQVASQALMADRPARLVFLWDTPMRVDPAALRGVGGFFFQRAGHPVAVDPVSLNPGEDPNTVLLGRAAQPHTAILWIYDLSVHDAAARRRPPVIGRLDPAWRCRNFGKGKLGVVACDKPELGQRPSTS